MYVINVKLEYLVNIRFIIKFSKVVTIFNVLHSMILNLHFKTLYFDVFNAMITHGPRDNSLCLKQFLLTQLFLSL